jgi:hypothetical protein
MVGDMINLALCIVMQDDWKVNTHGTQHKNGSVNFLKVVQES